MPHDISLALMRGGIPDGSVLSPIEICRHESVTRRSCRPFVAGYGRPTDSHRQLTEMRYLCARDFPILDHVVGQEGIQTGHTKL